MASDEYLIKQAQQGNHRAFDTLFARHQARIQAHCTRLLGSATEGEQAAQEVFLRAWQHLARFRSDCPLAHWLMRIAQNVCINLLRGTKGQAHTRRVSLDSPDIFDCGERSDLGSNLENEVIEQIAMEQLLSRIRYRAKIARPPWDALDWHIFHLLYEQNVTTRREVARLLHRSEHTIGYRIYRRIHPVLKAVGEEW